MLMNQKEQAEQTLEQDSKEEFKGNFDDNKRYKSLTAAKVLIY